MPKVIFTDSESARFVRGFSIALKGGFEDDGSFRSNDLGRLDLQTEWWLKRQADFFSGNSAKVRYAPENFCEETDSPWRFVVIGEVDGMFDKEFIDSSVHYFQKSVAFERLESGWSVHSESAHLASIFLRVVLQDLAYSGQLEKVRVIAGRDVLKRLETRLRRLELDVETVRAYLGGDFREPDVVHALERSWFDVVANGTGSISVGIPSHRVDVLNSSDLIEDVMIFSSCHSPESPPFRLSLFRGLDYSLVRSERTRKAADDEILSFWFKELKTSVMSWRYVLRERILESVLNYAKTTQNLPKPHRYFERGAVLSGDRLTENYVIFESSENVDFNFTFSLVCNVFARLGLWFPTLRPAVFPEWKAGASFEIFSEGRRVGTAGIVSDDVLRSRRIRHMAAFAEFTAELL